MFNYKTETLNRALRPTMILRDSNVIAEFEEFLDTMGLLETDNENFKSTTKLFNFATGFVAPDGVNIDKVFEVGNNILTEMNGQGVNQWKFTKSKSVRQMPVKAKTVVDHQQKTRPFDSSLALQRITLKHCTLEDALCHELAVLPPSLFTDTGFMRDSNKAKRARDLCTKWGVICERIDTNSTVFDGGMLLNHLRKAWKRGDTFGSFADLVVEHLKKHVQGDNHEVVTVMDGYGELTTKMHVQKKRNPVKSIEIQATKEMELKTTPDIFLSHPTNKQRLVDIVSVAIDASLNLSTRKSTGDADVLIVTTAVSLAESPVLIHADDSDILFLCLSQNITKNLFLKRSGVVYDIEATKNALPPEIAKYILVLHGLFGCDTTSGFYRRHSVFSTSWVKMTGHLETFLSNSSTKPQIQEAGQVLVAHRYNTKPPLNAARKKLYEKKAGDKKTFKQVNLATLPPTEDACNLHSLRAYHQIQEWLGNSLPPLEYGWKNIGEELHPIPTTLEPAPKSLIELQTCGCATSKCATKQCSCLKAGKYCSDSCQCVECLNQPAEVQPDNISLDDSLLDVTTEDEDDESQEDDSDEDVYGPDISDSDSD